MSRRFALLATVAVLWAPGAAGATPSACPAYEDDPAWSWSRCGNSARGVLVKGSDRVRVVDVCEYDRLRAAGRLSRRNVHMKGDGHAWAQRTECDR